jgi:hypothetical protein
MMTALESAHDYGDRTPACPSLGSGRPNPAPEITLSPGCVFKNPRIMPSTNAKCWSATQLPWDHLRPPGRAPIRLTGSLGTHLNRQPASTDTLGCLCCDRSSKWRPVPKNGPAVYGPPEPERIGGNAPAPVVRPAPFSLDAPHGGMATLSHEAYGKVERPWNLSQEAGLQVWHQ